MRFQPGAVVIRSMLMLAVAITGLNLLAIVVRFPACAGLVAIGYAYRRWRRWEGTGDAYGSARSSSLGQLWRNGMLGDDGIILGTCFYLGRPSRSDGIRAIFSPFLPSPIAVRLFFAAFLSIRWMER